MCHEGVWDHKACEIGQEKMTDMSLLQIMHWLIRCCFLWWQPWLLVEVWGNLPDKIAGEPHRKEGATGLKAAKGSPAPMPCHLDLKSYCWYSLCEVER